MLSFTELVRALFQSVLFFLIGVFGFGSLGGCVSSVRTGDVTWATSSRPDGVWSVRVHTPGIEFDGMFDGERAIVLTGDTISLIVSQVMRVIP